MHIHTKPAREREREDESVSENENGKQQLQHRGIERILKFIPSKQTQNLNCIVDDEVYIALESSMGINTLTPALGSRGNSNNNSKQQQQLKKRQQTIAKQEKHLHS